MTRVEKATLSDGRMVEYVVVPDPPEGGMKRTYFAPDRTYVIQFYKDEAIARDRYRRTRLEAVLERFNPTRDPDPKAAAYWSERFCWPSGIVTRPELGIMAPVFSKNYFFREGMLSGKEKEGSWFLLPKARRMLPNSERATWDRYLQISILIARAARRLHQAGLAHSDLSPKNVLVDPSSGQSTVIDIDSLVVPGVFPADVSGTPGFIAPEVLATMGLGLSDVRRKHPSVLTDQHALAVLIYQYLLLRHPLRGPKTHAPDPDEDERLSMGEKALFVEHPTDMSNRPDDLTVAYTALGPLLSELIERAFVKALHRPDERPAAIEWERALVKSWDLRIDCQNSACPNRWFILHERLRASPRCPFCGVKRTGTVPVLKFYRKGPGHLIRDGELVVYHNMSLFNWHVFDGIFPGEKADRTPQGYCAWHGGRWLFVNQQLSSLRNTSGTPVPPGQAVELTHDARITLSDDPHGRTAEVEILTLR